MTGLARRHLVVMLTDEEWRGLRVLVAQQDTTLTAWTTNVVLSELQAATRPEAKPTRRRKPPGTVTQ